MMMWRRVIRAPVNIRVGHAYHIQRFVLHLFHQPRGWRRATVRDSVPIVPRLVGPSVVHQRVVLGGEVVDLGLVVVVVMSGALDDVRGVVGGAAHAARGEGDAAHRVHAGRDREGLLQLLGVTRRMCGVGCVGGVRRRVRRGRCGRRPDCLQERLWKNGWLVSLKPMMMTSMMEYLGEQCCFSRKSEVFHDVFIIRLEFSL